MILANPVSGDGKNQLGLEDVGILLGECPPQEREVTENGRRKNNKERIIRGVKFYG